MKLETKTMLDYYATHSPFSDPGQNAHLFDALPQDIPGICKAIRGLVVHYVASGIEFAPERKAEIDTRWTERILQAIHTRDARPLSEARAPEERFVGCCRDFALLLVSVLRTRGVPARVRIGFASYFSPDFFHDHVLTEYWHRGEARWVMVDPELEETYPFNTYDLPPGQFLTSSKVWQRYRAGKLGAEKYGVALHLPFKGDWFIRNYVLQELAALNKHELLLWDSWGEMSDTVEGDLTNIDHIAEVVLSDDWEETRALFEKMDGPRATSRITCFSPTGNTKVEELAATVS